ncbi:MAG TPA: hypothetical protein ENK18_11845 [Deltaproteobacteria bacterium]|nr:hypothetical protein [Deltaproteobacteria bacterium]
MLTTLLFLEAAMADPPEIPRTEGLHELVLEVDGLERRYSVYLPRLPKKGTVPVVLALHYAGHGEPHYATRYLEQLVVPALKPLGAILLAPDCPGSSWVDPTSEPVVLALLDHAISSWSGDPERVVITGYSMGGMGTWHLAAGHPDRFAAAVPMAGHPGDNAARITVPVYAIHSQQDQQVPPGPTTGAIVVLRGRRIPALWRPVDGLTHHDTAAYVPALATSLPWIETMFDTTE